MHYPLLPLLVLMRNGPFLIMKLNLITTIMKCYMYIDYVRTHWFDLYHPDDWNQYYNASLESLTNNISESGNARLKKKHPSPNPGLFIKLDQLNLDFSYLRQHPKLYSMTMENLRSLTKTTMVNANFLF